MWIPNDFSRRQFLFQSLTGVSAAWLTGHWPAILSAAEHGRHAAHSSPPPQFEFLTPEQAADVEAITSQILPTDDSPGAREAGVVYFIDRSLHTYASDQQKPFLAGLAEVQAKMAGLFPGTPKFSAASPEQQIAVLKTIEKTPAFAMFRFGAICGFLSDPARGGNRNEIGWKLIGFDSSHVFQSPFGFYDRDYPGWQPAPPTPVKRDTK